MMFLTTNSLIGTVEYSSLSGAYAALQALAASTGFLLNKNGTRAQNKPFKERECPFEPNEVVEGYWPQLICGFAQGTPEEKAVYKDQVFCLLS